MILIVDIHIPGFIFHSVRKNMWHENIPWHELGLLAHAMGTLIAQGAALAVMLILRIHVYPRGLAEPFAVSGFQQSSRSPKQPWHLAHTTQPSDQMLQT